MATKRTPTQSSNNHNQNKSFLTQIIKTQSRLTEAEFNLNAFMQLVAEQMHILTPATGAVVELSLIHISEPTRPY